MTAIRLTQDERDRGTEWDGTSGGLWFSEYHVEAILTARLAGVEAALGRWQRHRDTLTPEGTRILDDLRAALAAAPSRGLELDGDDPNDRDAELYRCSAPGCCDGGGK